MHALVKRFGAAVLVCAGIASLFVVGPAAAKGGGCKPPTSASHFVTAPKLRPPRVRVCTRKHGIAPGMVFIGPFKDVQYGNKQVGQSGALMLDQGGKAVWFHPAPKNEQDSDIQTETLGSTNQQVISFWEGQIAIPPKITRLPAGAPVRGKYVFYNSKYHVVRTLKAQGKGWVTDFHELIITKPDGAHPQGTAIFLAAKKKFKNLRHWGGSAHGAYEDQQIQQVDLATNKLIFHWDVDQHIPLSASKVHAPTSGVWDPYHVNSINLNSAGDMLVSVRNTWGVYAIDPAGKFLWQVGATKCVTKKCLQPTKAAKFTWQHDARFDGSSKITMFDDGCCNLGVSGPEHAARGLILSLNFSKKRAGVVRQYRHASTKQVPTGGSFHFLSDGHAFVGWGQSYFYSEYTNGASLIYDAVMPKSDMSYRAWKAPWVGTPTTKPSAAVRKSGKKRTVYVSWNGATKVATWKVFAGKTSSKVNKLAGKAKRAGFETAIRVTNSGPYYKVQAYDSHGTLLGTSAVVH